jgi:hypothetical protein
LVNEAVDVRVRHIKIPRTLDKGIRDRNYLNCISVKYKGLVLEKAIMNFRVYSKWGIYYPFINIFSRKTFEIVTWFVGCIVG